MSPIDHDCTPQERNVLFDRIAELEAENERLHVRGDLAILNGHTEWVRAEKAEAALAEETEMRWTAVRLRNDAEAALLDLKERRCETCGSWDAVEAQTVSGVAYSICSHKSARCQHEGMVRPGYWLCPCWTVCAEEGTL